VGAKIDFDKVPLLPNVEKYRKMGCVPGGAKKNFASYGKHITELNQMQQEILCDAQTSGGLLVFVDKNDTKGFLDICKKHNMDLLPIGKTTSIFDDKKFIEVI
jgi:selenide,water dikinase